jgi:hypothetical protein
VTGTALALYDPGIRDVICDMEIPESDMAIKFPKR